MDPIRNPFAPGAGTQPPELAGRDEIINSASVALQRVLQGRHDKSQILLGLRGTGKTVLLNKIEALAESFGHVTSFIEAPEGRPLAALLYPKIYQALRKLSAVESAKSAVHNATRALRGFASAFKISVGDVSISVDPEKGVADSGNLEYDLTDLFVRVGEAAKAAGKAWTLLIDEVQYLSEKELAALIVAIHRVSQKQLPMMFSGPAFRKSPRFLVRRNRTQSACSTILPLALSTPLQRRRPYGSQSRLRKNPFLKKRWRSS